MEAVSGEGSDTLAELEVEVVVLVVAGTVDSELAVEV